MRQEAEFCKTILIARAVLDAPLQTMEGVQPGDDLEKMVEAYLNAMFPFQQADVKRAMDKMRNMLNTWVNSVDTITVEPLPDPVSEAKLARRVAKGRQQLVSRDLALSKHKRRKLA